MPRREWRVWLADILGAAERALRYVDGLSFDDFAKDGRTVDAVSYAILVIGEAARHLPAEVTRATPEVPWDEIRGMRNKVAHEYFGVDVRLLWDTVQGDLPPLLPLLRAVADRSDLG